MSTRLLYKGGKRDWCRFCGASVDFLIDYGDVPLPDACPNLIRYGTYMEDLHLVSKCGRCGHVLPLSGYLYGDSHDLCTGLYDNKTLDIPMLCAEFDAALNGKATGVECAIYSLNRVAPSLKCPSCGRPIVTARARKRYAIAPGRDVDVGLWVGVCLTCSGRTMPGLRGVATRNFVFPLSWEDNLEDAVRTAQLKEWDVLMKKFAPQARDGAVPATAQKKAPGRRAAGDGSSRRKAR